MSARDRLQDQVKRGLVYAMDERLAAHYERHLVEDCHYRTPDVVAQQLVEHRASGRWLDLGAGTGLVGKAALRLGLRIDFIAVDMSEAMLRLIDCPLYVAWKCADVAERLPFDDEGFDGVVAAGLFEHIVEPGLVLREAARLLQPGGLFVFTFPANRAGRTELEDSDEGLVSHDAERMRADLASSGLTATYALSFPAYRSGSKGWVTHHLVGGVRTVRSDRGQEFRIC